MQFGGARAQADGLFEGAARAGHVALLSAGHAAIIGGADTVSSAVGLRPSQPGHQAEGAHRGQASGPQAHWGKSRKQAGNSRQVQQKKTISESQPACKLAWSKLRPVVAAG